MKSFNFPLLYKMASGGATQQWDISVYSADGNSAVISVTYGQVGGKQQGTNTTVKSGKNIGRANETTAYEQAILEASAKWKKQKDKGYGEDIQVVRPEQKPMLAQKYEDYKHKITWDNAWAQPKLDGIRCLARWEDGQVKLYSRGNKPITTMGHIAKQLEYILKPCDGITQYPTLDGELYIHGEKFQNIVSWVKREQEDSLKVEYHVYDMIAPEDFNTRMEIYGIGNYATGPDCPNIHEVALVPIYSEDDLRRFHDKCVSCEYEGAMVRYGPCLYKEGYRSQQLLKFKAFIDEDFEIVGASEGKGRFEAMCVFRMTTKEGGLFDCMPEGTAEERREYWDNRDSYIGKMMTVRFFGWSTSAVPLPRFPIGVAVRDYE